MFAFDPSTTRQLWILALAVIDASAVVIPSWRHHLIQYDRLSAALEALKIPTAVSPLPDGLWAYLLQRLQVNKSCTMQLPLRLSGVGWNRWSCARLVALLWCQLVHLFSQGAAIWVPFCVCRPLLANMFKTNRCVRSCTFACQFEACTVSSGSVACSGVLFALVAAGTDVQ